MTSVSTETELDPNNTCEVNIQCNIEHIQCNIEQPKIDGDENLLTKSDEETSGESEYSIFDQSEAEYSSNNGSASVSSPSKAAFIVHWPSLTVVLNKCLTCCLPVSITNIALKVLNCLYNQYVQTSTRLFGDLNH